MTEPSASSPLAGLDPELVRALELSEAIAYNRDAYEGAAAIDDNRLGARWAEIGGGIASSLTTLELGVLQSHGRPRHRPPGDGGRHRCRRRLLTPTWASRRP